ncbi:SgcJ/EcaC family oxidoreductase [Acaryochloris marina]|uniref:SgcJ/EcaC family oxidoreductase n=1 Tax=Acaryochloris marina TaxID=155978 RepID=UPI0020172DCE|nr:SgcJ/EcaC family oxidoreductase [Acaryochloris marina]
MMNAAYQPAQPCSSAQPQQRTFLRIKNVIGMLLGCCLLLSFVCTPVLAETRCPTVAPAEIADLFEQWDQSLQTGQPSEVVKTYAPDAILVPTVSNRVRHTPAEIEDYFQGFLALKPDGRIVEQNIQVFCDLAVNSGLYAFAVVKEGRPSELMARFTFVYRKIGDRWLIVDHHSSGMPEQNI